MNVDNSKRFGASFVAGDWHGLRAALEAEAAALAVPDVELEPKPGVDRAETAAAELKGKAAEAEAAAQAAQEVQRAAPAEEATSTSGPHSSGECPAESASAKLAVLAIDAEPSQSGRKEVGGEGGVDCGDDSSRIAQDDDSGGESEDGAGPDADSGDGPGAGAGAGPAARVGLFDLVLSAETCYTEESCVGVARVLSEVLAPSRSACAVVATKRFYFGTGGGALCFRKAWCGGEFRTPHALNKIRTMSTKIKSINQSINQSVSQSGFIHSFIQPKFIS